MQGLHRRDGIGHDAFARLEAGKHGHGIAVAAPKPQLAQQQLLAIKDVSGGQLTALHQRRGRDPDLAHHLHVRVGHLRKRDLGSGARRRRAVALAGCLAARSERLLDRDLAAGLLERAEELELTDAQRLAVLEDVNNHTNIGAIFRLAPPSAFARTSRWISPQNNSS